MRFASVVGCLLVLSCSSKQGESTATQVPPVTSPEQPPIRGDRFAVAVQQGWRPATADDAPRPPGAVLLLAKDRVKPGWFLNSALFIRAGLQGQPNPAESVDRCRALGTALSGAQKVELHSASIGTSKHGPTCRVVIGDDRQRAVFVAVVVGATEFLAMTCNHDPRDENAAGGCDALFDTISLE